MNLGVDSEKSLLFGHFDVKSKQRLETQHLCSFYAVDLFHYIFHIQSPIELDFDFLPEVMNKNICENS